MLKRYLVAVPLFLIVLLGFSLLVSIFLAPIFLGTHEQKEPVLFETVSSGNYLNTSNAGVFVILDENDLHVWGLENEGASVNFESSVLVLVSAGGFISGGYIVEIQEIARRGTNLFVHIHLTTPGAGCAVTDALTWPYHLVSVDRVEIKRVLVTESSSRGPDCYVQSEPAY